MNPLQSLDEYETYVYTLADLSEKITRSTLTVIRRGASIAALRGEVEFVDGYRLVVREKLSFDSAGGRIRQYGYEAWCYGDLLYWYDSQPHPHVAELQVTYPHHKHVPPDIKHNRIPAPGMSFEKPNLSILIAEIEQMF